MLSMCMYTRIWYGSTSLALLTAFILNDVLAASHAIADLNELGEEVRVAEVVGRAHCQEDKGHQVRESRVIEDDEGKPIG